MTPLLRMTAIITALFIAMKWAVLAASSTRLSVSHRIAFFLWPGMRPSTFASRRQGGDYRWPLTRGVLHVAAGLTLFAIARNCVTTAAVPLVIVGFSLTVHFGLFSILTALWRIAGFRAEDLFRQPWRSVSLADFWSRRWNVGFSDMIAATVHRPIAARFGRRAGIAASFAMSALLHELAISVPAGGGYGLPTLYFALHGALVAADVRGRLATFAALVIPLPLVFHPPFIRAIVMPLLR